jgi:hypothetical protein
MYPIPTDLELPSIIGSALVQIGIGEFDVQFHFDSNAWIGCQGTLAFSVNGTVVSSWKGQGPLPAPIQSLLGSAPIGHIVSNPHQLDLIFDSRRVISFIDDSETYESFQIFFPGSSAPSIVV